MALTNRIIYYILVNFMFMLMHSDGLVQQCLYKKFSKPTDIRQRVAVSAFSLGNCAFQCTRRADCCEYLWNITSLTSQSCILLLLLDTNLSVDSITIEAPIDEGTDQWSLYTDGNLVPSETGCHKPRCDGLTVEVNSRTYLFEDKRLTWDDSLTSCQRRGMELVSIESPIEFDELKKILVKFPETFPKDADIWTSGTDRSEEGNWTWTKGDPNTELGIQSDWGWESGSKPTNDTTQNCLALWSSMIYKWHDQPCDTELISICEGIVISTTEPDTTKKSSNPKFLDQLKRGGKLGKSRVDA